MKQDSIKRVDKGWANMSIMLDENMPQKKKKKRFFWIWLFGGALAISGLVYYFATSPTIESQSNPTFVDAGIEEGADARIGTRSDAGIEEGLDAAIEEGADAGIGTRSDDQIANKVVAEIEDNIDVVTESKLNEAKQSNSDVNNASHNYTESTLESNGLIALQKSNIEPTNIDEERMTISEPSNNYSSNKLNINSINPRPNILVGNDGSIKSSDFKTPILDFDPLKTNLSILAIPKRGLVLNREIDTNSFQNHIELKTSPNPWTLKPFAFASADRFNSLDGWGGTIGFGINFLKYKRFNLGIGASYTLGSSQISESSYTKDINGELQDPANPELVDTEIAGGGSGGLGFNEGDMQEIIFIDYNKISYLSLSLNVHYMLNKSFGLKSSFGREFHSISQEFSDAVFAEDERNNLQNLVASRPSSFDPYFIEGGLLFSPGQSNLTIEGLYRHNLNSLFQVENLNFNSNKYSLRLSYAF